MEDVKVRVVVETQEAVSNVDKLNDKLEETVDKVDDVGEAAEGASTSIGSFGGAFEGAFKAIESATKGVGGAVGETVSSVKNAIPIVKNINSTAIKGLTGVKSAIAATGIGALIIALTTIVNHWEGFTKAVGISEEKFKTFKETVLNVLTNIVSGIVGVGNVIVQYLLTPIRTVIEAFKGLGNVVKDVFTGNWSNIKRDAENAAKGIGDAFRKGFNISENFQAGKAAGEKFIEGVKTTLTYKKPEVEETIEETVGAASKKVGAKAGKDFSEEFIKESKKRLESAEKDYDKIVLDLNKILNSVSESALKARREAGISEEYGGLISPDAIGKIDDIRQRKEEILQEIADFFEKAEEKRAEFTDLMYNGATPEIQEQALADLQALTASYDTLVDNISKIQDKFLKDEENAWIEDLQLFLDTEQDIINSHLIAVRDAKELEKQYYLEAFQSIADIFGSVADIEEERLNRLVREGKITEEEAKKQFEVIKGWQYAQTWINTLAGVVATFANPTAPYFVKAAQAASILATGIANTVKIANTQFGSPSGVGSGGNAASVGATPLNVMNDLTPTATMNIPVSNENTRVYILESDIQKSNNRVQIREDNTTW